MNIFEKLPFYLSVSALTLALAVPAHAQDADDQGTEEETEESEEIVVTGSLIPRTSKHRHFTGHCH